MSSTWYVNVAATTGSKTGTSWANAFQGAQGLQSALTAANSGDQIWVAQGTYTPTATTTRTVSFVLKSGVSIYGGFNGTETALTQRNFTSNVTILSGDIGVVGNYTDDSYHVVTGTGLTSATTLDGFTIEYGYANSVSTNDYFGGGIYLAASSSPTLANLIVTNNTATLTTASVQSQGAGMYESGGSPTLSNDTFSNNTASLTGTTATSGAAGGGGLVVGGGGTPTLSNVNFTNNTVTSGANLGSGAFGGGMLVFGGGIPVLNTVTFSGNSASSTGNSSSVGGGGLYVSSNSVTLTSVNFTNNTVSDTAAGAAPLGGGMYVAGLGGVSTLTGGTFSGNAATGASASGGGMCAAGGSQVSLNGVTFSNNTASAAATATGVLAPTGGGLSVNGVSTTLTNVTFSNNTASCNATAATTVAPGGGGMYVVGMSMPTLTNVTFSNNTASSTTAGADPVGGGMFVNGGRPTLNNVSFTGNAVTDSNTTPTSSQTTATPSGGGMFVTNNASPVLKAVIFSGNTAGLNGGGMDIQGQSTPNLTNCVFYGNAADENAVGGKGGGICDDDNGGPTLMNCTFNANTASSGGAIENTSTGNNFAFVTNSILWGDTATAGLPEINSDGASASSVNYSIVQGGYTGTGNQNLNPLFIPIPNFPTDPPVFIQAGSPAVDNGTSKGAPTTDLIGDSRPFNATGAATAAVDIGALESESFDVPPTAGIANSPYNAVYGGNITLDGSLSSTTDSAIASYQWDTNYNGSTFNPVYTTAQSTDTVSTAAMTLAPNLTGTATPVIALRVADEAGAGVKSSVVITNATISAVPASVVKVSTNLALLTTAAIGNGTFTVTLTYNETMNTSIAPAISFTSTPAVGGTLVFASGTWGDLQDYTATYNVVYTQALISGVGIDVSGAQDLTNGNTQIAYTGTNNFSINQTGPIVDNVGVNVPWLTFANEGPGTFTVTATYNEAMNTSAKLFPTISFTPAVDTAPTKLLTFAGGSWSGDAYTATYNVGTAALDIANVDIAVSGAQDTNGDTQVPFWGSDVFGIDMLQPAVSAITPTAGPLLGDTTVTITGTYFTGATAVDFGTSAAIFTVSSDTQIVATSPAGTGTVDVTVVTAGGTSATSAADQFSYLAAPTVTGVDPAGGPLAGGTTVTIAGTGFTDATAVDFGATAIGSFTVNSDTQITAISPAGTGTVNVTVVTAGGTSATSAADHFSYSAAPAVTAISPATGPMTGGTNVTITGTGFSDATAVDFGKLAASDFTVDSALQIMAISPPGAGAVNVTVVAAGGTSAASTANRYTYVAAPVVIGVTPATGPMTGGTTVTIAGTGLAGATAVDFGATPAAAFTVNSAAQITATSPAGAGAVNVTVVTVGGTSASSTADQFSYLGAATFALTGPSAGSFTAGQNVTIQWTAANVDVVGGSTITLGYDADATPFDANEHWIEAARVTAANGAAAYGWNTTGIAPGTYYLSGYMYDPATSQTVYSHLGAPIVVTAGAPAPAFKLTGPSAGTFTAAASVTIQWTAASIDVAGVSKISLGYEPDATPFDANESWIEVDQVTAANGAASYAWNTTGIASGTYYLSGYMYDFALNHAVYSNLGAPIVITGGASPAFTLTGPSAGTFTAEHSLTIAWTAANVDVAGPTKISLGYDPGATPFDANQHWFEVDGVTAANGAASYAWNTTGIASGTYYLSGYMYDFATGKAVYSHLTTSIVITGGAPPAFTLSGPSAGTITAGHSLTIAWTAANVDVAGPTKITLGYDPDVTPFDANQHWLEVDGVTAANGAASYSWNTTGIASGTYYLNGYMYDFATGKAVYSSLGTPIVITGGAPPAFTLSGPSAGTFTAGQSVTIAWTAANVDVAGSTKITLGYDSDATPFDANQHWLEIDGVAAANGAGSYAWNTTGIATGTYYLSGYMYDFATSQAVYSHLGTSIVIT